MDRVLKANKIFMVVVGVMTLVVSSAGAAQTFFVSNNNDAGPGSLRAALENTSTGKRVIKIWPWVRTIKVLSTLEYTLEQPLTIMGFGKRTKISGERFDVGNLFESTGGADLTLRNLAFMKGAEGNIFIDIPDGRTGTIKFNLHHVAVTGSRDGDGFEIDNLDGVPVSIKATFKDTHFVSADDSGVSIFSRGDGDLFFTSIRSSFIKSGCNDNVDLAKQGPGSLIVNIRDSHFDDSAEGNGFDAFEDDEGDLFIRCVRSTFDGNDVADQTTDKGMEISENDAGSLHLNLVRVSASDNSGTGIDLSEDGEGDSDVSFRRVETDDNGLGFPGNTEQHGIELESEDLGKTKVTAIRLKSRGNRNNGLRVVGEQRVDVDVIRSKLTDNGGVADPPDGYGIVVNSDIATGELNVFRTDLSGNASGEIDSNVIP